MPTLLLQCVAPLQAWDTQSNFGVRTTGREPSKSGIIGLLCAVNDLAELRMGVRVDMEGHILRDWHTAGKDGYLKAGGSVERKNVITSTRYYLTDAAFLVGLESESIALLQKLHNALNHPRWILFLGRKSCPPAAPPYLPDGLCEGDLLTALTAYHWLSRSRRRYDQLRRDNPRGLRLVLEDAAAGILVRQDHPLSYEKGNRQFAPRRMSTVWADWPSFYEERS
jgi:CRISPR system Cascade subunit CasD